jgi:hypothetical protein
MPGTTFVIMEPLLAVCVRLKLRGPAQKQGRERERERERREELFSLGPRIMGVVQKQDNKSKRRRREMSRAWLVNDHFI